jgi:hypothetical protein
LQQSEYDSIVSALDVPSKSKHQGKVIEYRNGIVHRIRPSVDYPELFTEMEDRIGEPIYDDTGNEKARRFSIRAKPSPTPQFYFTDLHAALLDYMKHVIEMLTQLKRVPRLA